MPIEDSGTRREFETGAVRDIQEGKGRCDLLPLDVMSQWLADSVMHSIDVFMMTGDYHNLYTVLDEFIGADSLKFNAMLALSQHFEDGAVKYGEDNWKKGIPTHCYIDSAVRHYLKWRRGDKDETHYIAFIWNIVCCIWTCVHKPELNDYRKVEEK